MSQRSWPTLPQTSKVLLAATAAPAGLAALDESQRARLEQLVSATARSEIPWLDRELARLLRRPGKRVRPALLFAAAACGTPADPDATLACAAAVELLHQSTLVHDDLMDDAPFRGEEVTLHRTGGPAAAVLGGDYLFGVAGRLIAGVSARAACIWHDAYVDLCQGQARETANRYRVTPIAEYVRTVHGKTASLVRAACQLGAVCGGLDDAQVAALGGYGEHFGVLFQIVDDLLDVVSTPELCHKPVRQDVAQGVYSLPVLLAHRARPMPLGPDLSAGEIAEVYQTVCAHALVPAVAAAYVRADQARDALCALPPSPARDRLAELPAGYATATLAERVASAYQPLVRPLLRASA